MAKIKLITNPAGSYLYLPLHWVRPYISDTFTIEPYDSTQTYNSQDTVVLISYVEQLEQADWYQPLEQAGFKVLVEHLADSDVDCPSHVDSGRLTLRCPNWMWYNACMQWRQLGHNQYRPERHYRYRFFMPMNLPRWHRTLMLTALKDLLPEALYSYHARGIELPQDLPADNGQDWRSYFDPVWYNSTPFSIVAESYMRSKLWLLNNQNYLTEVSEKIFKPMLGQQPFIVYGSADTLKYLKREGFVTFDNLFDESYDSIIPDQERFDSVTRTVQSACLTVDYRSFKIDTETQQRIEHNHRHLFDIDTVNARFKQEVIADILEWLE